MRQNLEGMPQSQFIFPDIKYEMGEIERTAKTFAPDKVEQFVHDFVTQALTAKLVDLSEDVWSKLENTDSFDIKKGDWETVNYHASAEGINRDWKSKKEAMEAGKDIHAPIILKIGETYHKVAGNTRLMVARASGKTPKVLIVELEDKHFS